MADRFIEVLNRGGEMGRRIAAIDWSSTPLGPIESWTPAFRTMLGMVLSARSALHVWWGPEFRMFYNDAAIAVFGAKHPMSIGEPGLGPHGWWEIAPVIEAALRSVLAGGPATSEADQLLVMQRRGFPEETYVSYSYSAIPDDTGGIGGVLTIFTETTARFVGERRLRTLQELAAKRVVEATTVAAACEASMEALRANDADLSFALLYLRDAAGWRLAGAAGERGGIGAIAWPLDEVVGGDRSLHVADAAARFGDLPGGRWPEPAREVLLLPVSTGNGVEGVLVAGISPRLPLDAEYNRFLHLVGAQVTAGLARARSLEEATARAEALAALDRAKTVFFSNVSHEFRTPLTLMVGPLRDALAAPVPALAGRDLEAVHRNALRLVRLTNALLDFSRIEAGRIHAAYEPTDLARLTDGLASVFRSMLESAGLTLTVDCPPLGEEVWVDRQMWEKVVLNLVSNAFKHTLEGGITVSLAIEGEEVVLRVADTGVGIAAEHLPRLFERFHRVLHARSRTHEGAGIGLALVQEIARLHGGGVEVESEPGVGTVFTVRCPRGAAHLPPERIVPARPMDAVPDAAPFLEEAHGWVASEDEAPPAAPAPGEARARVLVADDNADMRESLRRLLARHWIVETAADGERALALARACPPDLLVADVMMPGIDGFALLRALRADDTTRLVPVLLLSARAGEEARVEGLDAGADDYVVKPFVAQELVARVRSLLELSRLRREREREAERMNAELSRRIAERTKDLVERTEELVATNGELAAFTYTVAHDLRAPLRALHRCAQALREEYADRLDDAGRGYTQRIAVAARRMDDLITNLLAYGHVSRADMRTARVDLDGIVREAGRVHGATGATLEVDEPMPSVVGDPVLVAQIVHNLVQNAVKYVPPDTPPRVRVGFRRAGGTVHVRVRDNGIGIAPQHQDRVFRVFERLHGQAEYDGTGIGLAIVKRAVERMGGRVGVESELGRGSTFWFELPEARP